MSLAIQNIESQLSLYHDEISKLKEIADRYETFDSKSVTNALSFAFQAKSLHKRIEDKRKEIIEPARDFISKINSEAKKFTETLEHIETALIEKVDSWKECAEFFPFDVVVDYSGDQFTSYEKEYFVVEVQDISRVPLEFLQVNEKLIEKMAQSGVRSIPGVSIQKRSKTILKTK